MLYQTREHVLEKSIMREKKTRKLAFTFLPFLLFDMTGSDHTILFDMNKVIKININLVRRHMKSVIPGGK